MTFIIDSYEEEQAFRAREAHQRERQSSSRSATSSPQIQSTDTGLTICDQALEDAASSIRLAAGRDAFTYNTCCQLIWLLLLS